MNAFTSSILLLAATAMASYVEVPFPGPTNAQEHFEMMVHGAMPAPTEPPVLRFDWLKRQTATAELSSAVDSGTSDSGASATNGTTGDSSSDSQIGWLAPDNTCGYIGGSLGAALTCSTTEYCAAATITGQGKMACCGSASNAPCTFFLTCIDYAAYVTSSACDHVCLQDINTMKCLNSNYPFCFPYTVPGVDALYYSCDAFTTTSPQPLLTTFIGETDGRSWTPVYNTSASTASALVNTQHVTETGIGSDQTSTGAGLAGGNTSGTSSTASPTPTQSPSENKSSTPVGAIVGGVVGGLAVIAIGVGAVVFFCLRSRRQQQQPPAPTDAQQPAMAAAQSPQAYGAPAQYDYKQPQAVQSPVPPRYSHVEPGLSNNTAELSGDYHQPVINPQGQQAHELPPAQQAMH